MAPRVVLCLLALVAGCVGPEDDPSRVRDLRVLGVSFEPPELLAERCERDVQALAVFASPVRMTALIADPQGGGRAIAWELLACASQADRTCSNEPDRVLLESGSTAPGELTVARRFGATVLPGGTPLLQRVLEEDQFRGLGGLRMPLVLRVKAGSEEIYALKLMPFGCKVFPQMRQNATPLLPGLSIPALEGSGPFRIEASDFSHLEEGYVVPSFELQPVNLVESWKISWHADLGRFSPGETGGMDLGGQQSRHAVEWAPGRDSVEREVTFWAVVRDGRGGESWVIRRALNKP